MFQHISEIFTIFQRWGRLREQYQTHQIDRFVVSSYFKTVIWNFSNLFSSNKFLILVSIFGESAQASHAYNKMGLTSESYRLRCVSMFLFYEEER